MEDGVFGGGGSGVWGRSVVHSTLQLRALLRRVAPACSDSSESSSISFSDSGSGSIPAAALCTASSNCLDVVGDNGSFLVLFCNLGDLRRGDIGSSFTFTLLHKKTYQHLSSKISVQVHISLREQNRMMCRCTSSRCPALVRDPTSLL